MTVRVDSEEIETTTSEKVLAFVLAAFILIGAIWTYYKLDEVAQPPTSFQVYRQAGSPNDRTAVQRHRAALAELQTAKRTLDTARNNLELRREAFRTALEAGDPTAQPELAYRRAQTDFAAAQRHANQAKARAATTGPAATAAEARIQRAQDDVADKVRSDERSHDRKVFLLRLVLVLLMLGGGYWLLGRMRSSRSRYLPVALADIGAATVLALVMATDYTTDYIDVEELGPLALSLTGIAMTLAAFAALQRYLAKRIPLRRVRRHECPFCGFPVAGNDSCEGCGRRVIGECSSCHRPRRVGTQHCGACGAA